MGVFTFSLLYTTAMRITFCVFSYAQTHYAIPPLLTCANALTHPDHAPQGRSYSIARGAPHRPRESAHPFRTRDDGSDRWSARHWCHQSTDSCRCVHVETRSAHQRLLCQSARHGDQVDQVGRRNVRINFSSFCSLFQHISKFFYAFYGYSALILYDCRF